MASLVSSHGEEFLTLDDIAESELGCRSVVEDMQHGYSTNHTPPQTGPGVSIRVRRAGFLRWHPPCFVASEAVDWLLQYSRDKYIFNALPQVNDV